MSLDHAGVILFLRLPIAERATPLVPRRPSSLFRFGQECFGMEGSLPYGLLLRYLG